MADRREAGIAALLVPLLAFSAITVVYLAVEIGRLAGAWREAAFAADAGAVAAAATLDETARYRGVIALDLVRSPAVATEAAQASRPRPGRHVLATITPQRACVEVTQPHDAGLLGRLGLVPVELTASACAEPAEG